MMASHRWLVALSVSLLLPVVQPLHASEAESLEARVQRLESELATLKALLEATLTDPAVADDANLAIVDIKPDGRPAALARQQEPQAAGFGYEGFVQFDTLVTHYSDGKPATSTIDDFLVPSDIPVDPDAEGGFTSTNMSAKSSRFGFTTDHQLEQGRIRSLVELDFALSSQGNERISNSWSSRLRHAYLDWQWSETGSVRAGQYWTTFMRAEARPALWDLTGGVGQTFNRQPLIRLRQGAWSLALENPATRLDGVDYSSQQEAFPDVIARYDGEFGGLGWTVAGMVRQLNYRDDSHSQGPRKDDAWGYATSAAGNWTWGANDIRFMFNYGDALGRYMGLNAFNDGLVGLDGNIVTYDQWGGLLSWSRRFTPHWQAGVTVSAAWADVPGDAVYPGAGLLPDQYVSSHINLWYRPTPKLAIGSEYIRAVKELHNGDKGDLDRLMFSLRYSLK